MSLNTTNLVDGLVSNSMSLGVFERVNTHEPKNAPSVDGLFTAIWVDRIVPHAEHSGLAATSAYVVMMQRIYSNMLQEPQDAIDPNVMLAVDVLMGQYTGDFTLGGEVAYIDLLGIGISRLEAKAGYITIDKKVYRVMDVIIPCVVNDAWTQTA